MAVAAAAVAVIVVAVVVIVIVVVTKVIVFGSLNATYQLQSFISSTLQ